MMNSFAFFHDSNNNIEADLHINIWTLEEEKPIIDIGMKIYNTNSNIKNICIYIPDKIKENEIYDLSDKLTDPN